MSNKVWISLVILVVGCFVSMLTSHYLGQKTESIVLQASDSLYSATMNSNADLTAFKEQTKGYNDAVLMDEESILALTEEKSEEMTQSLAVTLKIDAQKTTSELAEQPQCIEESLARYKVRNVQTTQRRINPQMLIIYY